MNMAEWFACCVRAETGCSGKVTIVLALHRLRRCS
jgi:hypothetical protein